MSHTPLPLLALLIAGFVATICNTVAQDSAPNSATTTTGARFSNGIVAIVEDRIITVAEVRRAMEPQLPQIRAQSRTEAEFRKSIEHAEDRIIHELVDEALAVKRAYSDENSRIPSEIVDQRIEQDIKSQFDGDRSKLLAYLRSIGKTHSEYRRMVEAQIILENVRSQKSR